MSTEERDQRVDDLLHDAEHADSGAWFAKRMGNQEVQDSLAEKAKRLRAEALAIDPQRTAPAWEYESERPPV